MTRKVYFLRIFFGGGFFFRKFSIFRVFYDFLDVGQYFACKRYFNTIIRPWDLSRIVDNGKLYILIEYNVFWTGPVRVRSGPHGGVPMGSQGGLPWGSQGALWADGPWAMGRWALWADWPFGPGPMGPGPWAQGPATNIT